MTLALAAVATFAAIPGHAGATLALHVTPYVATEPATVTIRATVERHEDNRGLQIQITSSGYCRSSFVQLDGLDAPRTTTATYPEVPGGLYEVRTTVVGAGGKVLATDSRDIRIVARFGG